MKMCRIKNIFIFLLVILTFVQTKKLWFGDNPNLNFFYSFFGESSKDINSDNLAQLSKPYRMILNNGNDEFLIKYSNINESEQKQIMDEIMEKMFEDGEFVSVSTIDWKMLLSKSLVFEYKCKIPTVAFTASYNQKSSLLTAKFKNLKNLFLIPSNNSFEPVRIIFFDDETNNCYEYKIEQDNLNKKLIHAKDNFSVKNNNIRYILGEASLYNVFSDNIFIAKWDVGGMEFFNINKINPYEENGDVLYVTIEDKIDVFFDNAAKMERIDIEGSDGKIPYAFSDENTVVKYYQSGVLEYHNYGAIDEKIVTTFISAYNKAIEFIKKDKTITEKDDYYLANYTKDDENNWIFYFDYVINDFPINISSRISSSPEITNAIELVVAHDSVIKYVKYAYSYEINENMKSVATKDFEEALNMAFSEELNQEEENQGLIKSLDIGYNVEDSETTGMYWHMLLRYEKDLKISIPAY